MIVKCLQWRNLSKSPILLARSGSRFKLIVFMAVLKEVVITLSILFASSYSVANMVAGRPDRAKGLSWAPNVIPRATSYAFRHLIPTGRGPAVAIK